MACEIRKRYHEGLSESLMRRVTGQNRLLEPNKAAHPLDTLCRRLRQESSAHSVGSLRSSESSSGICAPNGIQILLQSHEFGAVAGENVALAESPLGGHHEQLKTP